VPVPLVLALLAEVPVPTVDTLPVVELPPLLDVVPVVLLIVPPSTTGSPTVMLSGLQLVTKAAAARQIQETTGLFRHMFLLR
jgi:hypothetical protein